MSLDFYQLTCMKIPYCQREILKIHNFKIFYFPTAIWKFVFLVEHQQSLRF